MTLRTKSGEALAQRRVLPSSIFGVPRTCVRLLMSLGCGVSRLSLPTSRSQIPLCHTPVLPLNPPLSLADPISPPQYSTPARYNLLNDSLTLIMTTDLTTRPAPQLQHSYGTRKRQSSVLRPPLAPRDPADPPPLTLTLQPRRIRPFGSPAPSPNTPPLLRFRCDREEREKEERHLEQLRSQLIHFPPQHVVLHPDDANSKVFLAMGRALWSAVSPPWPLDCIRVPYDLLTHQENRAMTVKDLAEQSVKFGLVCQKCVGYLISYIHV